ncbi:MBL fold metallo-hydrolase [Spiractinospora alimapuensis]|uniref:MBL fold metallo-hydrolase n=1 Tax=Spiractinospora alimapuensis TaxID=2820884 RepID=UPI001F2A8BF8|nr:MBL fold metallo-hydrolase [Spiractinospora alimapuensis]QVQ52106.1 MBL fold metallo-hydrolase [Spiractinospora alimapuensis]
MTANDRPSTDTTETVDLGDEVYAIDTRMAGCPGITSSYLIRAEKPCLVEVGAAGSAPLLRDRVAALGVAPEDLATVAVTHIHLDHAGGTGDIAAMFPNATIVVHENGARHLAQPERLIRSARQVFGAAFDTLFGDLVPTDPARIQAVGERGSIDLGGGRELATHFTPGHAKHHIGLVDSQNGDLYVGDALGIYDARTGEVHPATPPPDFDLDAARATFDLLSDIAPRRLMFSHFAASRDTGRLLDLAREELHHWVETVREAHSGPGDLDHAVALVRERVTSRYQEPAEPADERTREVLDILSGPEPNTAGIWHWLDRLAAQQRAERDGDVRQ